MMKRPEGFPEEFWHDESPLECLRWLEETARFLREAGLYDDPSICLDLDWREQIRKIMDQRAVTDRILLP